jgi:hypothetical protein
MTRRFCLAGAVLALTAGLGLTACGSKDVTPSQRAAYAFVLWALGYDTDDLYAYGMDSDGSINSTPLSIYPDRHAHPSYFLAATSVNSGYHYLVDTDTDDDDMDVYSYDDEDGHLVYEGTITDTYGPRALVYDPYWDEYFVIEAGTSTVAVYETLGALPFLELGDRYTIPEGAGAAVIIPSTENFYIGGSVGTSSSQDFDLTGYSRGANKTLNPIGNYRYGSQVSWLGLIGNVGNFADIDNGGSGGAIQVQVLLDHATGGPTVIQQIPLAGATTGGCTSGALDTTFCYFAIGNGIAQYQFNASSGQLTALSPGAITTGTAALTRLSIGPSDTFLLASDANGYTTSYPIGSTGQVGAPISSIPHANFALPFRLSF